MNLGAALERTRSRVGFTARLARASWTALAAAVAVELGAIAARGFPHAFQLGVGAGAALVLAALLLLVLGRRPSRTDAARRLDAALAKGSLVETAAEALDGKHGPLGGLVVAGAEEALASSPLTRLVPIEPPRALGAGAGAALLLLAVALGPAAEAVPESTTPRPPEIDLDQSTATGAATTARKNGRLVASPGRAPGPNSPARCGDGPGSRQGAPRARVAAGSTRRSRFAERREARDDRARGRPRQGRSRRGARRDPRARDGGRRAGREGGREGGGHAHRQEGQPRERGRWSRRGDQHHRRVERGRARRRRHPRARSRQVRGTGLLLAGSTRGGALPGRDRIESSPST